MDGANNPSVPMCELFFALELKLAPAQLVAADLLGTGSAPARRAKRNRKNPNDHP